MLFNLTHFNQFGDLAGFLLLTTYIFSKHFHICDFSKKESNTEQRCSRNTPNNDKEVGFMYGEECRSNEERID